MSWRPVPSESDKTRLHYITPWRAGRIADRTNLSELTVYQCFILVELVLRDFLKWY